MASVQLALNSLNFVKIKNKFGKRKENILAFDFHIFIFLLLWGVFCSTNVLETFIITSQKFMERLTEAQQELYEWLAEYIRTHQHSPSIRQMM